METAIDGGVIFEVGGDFGDPGAGHHDTPGGGDALGDGFDGALVGGVGHAGVVDMGEDDDVGGFPSEAFGEGGGCGGSG
ncbi:MAG: hypothetical protein RI897_2799 [Verrucomicrobiota bacterium]